MATPPHRLPWGNAVRSNLVTIPKLLEPPFSTVNKSGFVWLFASTIEPSASTTYIFLAVFSTQMGMVLLGNWRRYRRLSHSEQQKTSFHLGLLASNCWDGGTSSPPSVKPATPTLPARPPETDTPNLSSSWYTFIHLLPEPIEAVDLSLL